MRTLNITLKVDPKKENELIDYLINKYDFISSRVLPDTQELHDTSEPFRKLVKKVKAAQWERDTFINENNQIMIGLKLLRLLPQRYEHLKYKYITWWFGKQKNKAW